MTDLSANQVTENPSDTGTTSRGETRDINQVESGETAATSNRLPPKFRGAQGALVYGLFNLGITFVLGILAGLAVAGLTDQVELGVIVFGRVILFGASASLAATLSRWIAGGETDGLLSLKLVRGDLGGIAGLLVGILVAGNLAPDVQLSEGGPNIKIGETIEIAGPLFGGGQYNLADHRGKVVLVDFWATWCQPCIEELPNVKAVYDKYHDDGFEVIGVSLDISANELGRFLAESPEPWSQIYFNPTDDDSLANRYQVNGIPFLIVIGKDGKVAAVDVRGDEIEAGVAVALQGGTLAPGIGKRFLKFIVATIVLSPWWILLTGIVGFGVVGAMIERRLQGATTGA